MGIDLHSCEICKEAKTMYGSHIICCGKILFAPQFNKKYITILYICLFVLFVKNQ
jgi:hypothetical protein